MGIEQELQEKLISKNPEKTFIDKLLAKDDIEKIREIIRKENLTRQDILDLLYLLSSSESKLYNFSEWDRHVILKFYVWIREFCKVAEQLYDYTDRLGRKGIKNETLKQLLKNNKLLIQHNIKFVVDLYLNICRTSLSLGATGFMELLKNKYEMIYPNQPLATASQEGRGIIKVK